MSTELASTSDAAPSEPAEQSNFFKAYLKTASTVTNLFPVWTVISTIWALKRPADFAWFTTEYFTAGLAALMLSMGITLAPADFVRVGKRPNAVVIQVRVESEAASVLVLLIPMMEIYPMNFVEYDMRPALRRQAQ